MLVLGVDAGERIPDELLEYVEPVFLASESAELRFPAAYHRLLLDYFWHRIARDPQDLRSHVRRIFLNYEHGQAADLFAALLDLFIALHNKGASLRGRLLESSRAKLDSEAYRLLRATLPDGMVAAKAPFVPGSFLCQGAEGALQCVYLTTENTVTTRDPLVEAREYMEYSQVEEARNVLERAVLEQCHRSDLHQELLDIYRSTRDQRNFAKMLRELDNINNPVPEAWQDLANFFRSLNV